MVCNLSLSLLFLFAGDSLSTGILSISSETDVSEYSSTQSMVWLIPKLVFLYSLYRLLRLFILFSKEDFFSISAINHLKWFSGFYMISTLLHIIVGGVLDLWVSGVGESELALKLNIDSGEIGEFGMAVVFFIVAFILNEARQHKEALERFF